MAKKNNIRSEKAQKILRDAAIRGKALTAAQKRFFGSVADKKKPRKPILIASPRG